MTTEDDDFFISENVMATLTVDVDVVGAFSEESAVSQARGVMIDLLQQDCDIIIERDSDPDLPDNDLYKVVEAFLRTIEMMGEQGVEGLSESSRYALRGALERLEWVSEQLEADDDAGS